MRTRVIVPPAIQAVIEELPEREQDALVEKLTLVERFPRMYAVVERGRFRRHRRFLIGSWVVYYRVVENTVYIRGLWPARMP